MSREQREEEMISGFSEITGSPADNSRFFLESANWNLELALTNFYEGGYPNVQPEIEAESDQMGLNFVQDLNLEAQENDGSNDEPEARGSSEDNNLTVVSSQTPITNSNVNQSRFATISTLLADESSSDEEEGQAYYAGGSEHSGQQVVGPWRPPHEIIADLFRSLRDQGGVEAISHEPGGTQFFAGKGYRLGHSSDDSHVVNPNNGGASTGGSQTHREVILRLWRDGFSVDSGPLRSYGDPQEREFLSRIRQGNVPAELFPQVEGGAVHLSLEDHRHENYVATATRPIPFTGRGHVLGSTASEIRIKETKEEVEEKQNNQPVASSSIKVDESSPKTTIQIRLPEGDKIQVTLNQSHTIADLRATIVEQLPQYHAGNFTLMTTFPSRELNDDNITLKQADILNSSILLRH